MVCWYSFDEGRSLGAAGSESGTIVRDDEHPEGARITLERDGESAPYSITCGVYGLLVHTRFFSTLAEAEREYEAMRLGLAEVLSRVRRGEDEREVATWFVERFP